MEQQNNQTEPTEPQASVAPTTPATEETSGSYKTWLMVAVVVVVIILVFAAGYFYMMKQNSLLPAQVNSVTSQTIDEVKSLGTELNLVEDTNIEADFTQVDQDLKSL